MAELFAKENWHLDKKVPLTLIVALMIQAASFVWWAAAQSFENQAQNIRIDHLELALEKNQNTQSIILERLATIEAQQRAQMDTLNRIYNVMDKKVDRK